MRGRLLDLLGYVLGIALWGVLLIFVIVLWLLLTGEVRLVSASQRLDQAPVGGGGAFRAGLADRTPLARPLSTASQGIGRPVPPSGRAAAAVPSLAVGSAQTCASPCSVDVSEYDVPTAEPVLRPLASDCRLPCYGTARVGPASWYNAGSGYYAAIPGYLGGVVSVAVCTFPEGRANCHTFPVTTSCQCYRHERRERVVDLSPAAFRLFAPLSAGLVMVQITVLGGKP